MKIHNELRFRRRAFDLWTEKKGPGPDCNAQIAVTLQNEGITDMPASRQVIKAAVNKEQARRKKLAALPALDRVAGERAQLVQELQLDVIEALTSLTPNGQDIQDILTLRQRVAKMDALDPAGEPLKEAAQVLSGPESATISEQLRALFTDPAELDAIAAVEAAAAAGILPEPARHPENPNQDVQA